MVTYQDYDGSIDELRGIMCNGIAATADDEHNLVVLFFNLAGRWHRAFLDEGVLFLMPGTPAEDLDDGELPIMPAPPDLHFPQRLESFDIRKGTLTVKFTRGSTLTISTAPAGGHILKWG